MSEVVETKDTLENFPPMKVFLSLYQEMRMVMDLNVNSDVSDFRNLVIGQVRLKNKKWNAIRVEQPYLKLRENGFTIMLISQFYSERSWKEIIKWLLVGLSEEDKTFIRDTRQGK
jgi:hypothetical protein